MKVLVCGGRDFTDYDHVANVLLRPEFYPSFIVHGAARGADNQAEYFSRVQLVPCRRYPANWRKYGKAAGPIRNQEMLDKEKPDLVIAFHGGRGTADMVRRARAAGVRVVVCCEDT